MKCDVMGQPRLLRFSSPRDAIFVARLAFHLCALRDATAAAAFTRRKSLAMPLLGRIHGARQPACAAITRQEPRPLAA